MVAVGEGEWNEVAPGCAWNDYGDLKVCVDYRDLCVHDGEFVQQLSWTEVKPLLLPHVSTCSQHFTKITKSRK